MPDLEDAISIFLGASRIHKVLYVDFMLGVIKVSLHLMT